MWAEKIFSHGSTLHFTWSSVSVVQALSLMLLEDLCKNALLSVCLHGLLMLFYSIMLSSSRGELLVFPFLYLL